MSEFQRVYVSCSVQVLNSLNPQSPGSQWGYKRARVPMQECILDILHDPATTTRAWSIGGNKFLGRGHTLWSLYLSIIVHHYLMFIFPIFICLTYTWTSSIMGKTLSKRPLTLNKKTLHMHTVFLHVLLVVLAEARSNLHKLLPQSKTGAWRND